jgi:hypothetical protein
MPKTLKKFGGASIASSKSPRISKKHNEKIDNFIQFNYDAISHNIFGPITEFLPLILNNIYNHVNESDEIHEYNSGAPAFILIQESTDGFGISRNIIVKTEDHLERSGYQIKINREMCDRYSSRMYEYGDISVQFSNFIILPKGSIINCQVEVYHRSSERLLVTYTGIIMVIDPTGKGNYKNIVTFVRNDKELKINGCYIWGCYSIQYKNTKNEYNKDNGYPQHIMPPTVVSISNNVTLVMRSNSKEDAHNQRNILCVDIQINDYNYIIANTHASFKRIKLCVNTATEIGYNISKLKKNIYDYNIPVSFNLPYCEDRRGELTNYPCPTQRGRPEYYDESRGNILDYAISNGSISSCSYITEYGQKPGTRVESDHSAIKFENIVNLDDNCRDIKMCTFDILHEILSCRDRKGAGIDDFMIINGSHQTISENYEYLPTVKYGLFLSSSLMLFARNNKRRCFIFGDFNSSPVTDIYSGDKHWNSAYFYTLIIKKHINCFDYEDYTKRVHRIIPIITE